ncbi:MAG: hypothetical protein GWO24_14025, partial [Akkermansiaceae bacterium]|nr:hypothetical protein [Akkermansiaceae bacterium]
MSLPAPIPFALDPRLRSLGLASPFAMAPMSGVTNAPFRLLARRAGAAQTFSETLSARRLVRRGEAPRLSLVGDDEVAAQIFGGDAEEMAEAAGRLGERGVRWVDLNFG